MRRTAWTWAILALCSSALVAATPHPQSVAAGDTFAARIAFDGATHLPVRLVFWSGDRTALTTEYADRRKAGDMKLPYRIVTRAGERVVDEMLFDEVAFNPKLTKADFSR